MLARQLAYITYVRGSMSTLQILLFHYFYGFMPPTLSREEPDNYDFLCHWEPESFDILRELSDHGEAALMCLWVLIINNLEKEALPPHADRVALSA